MNKQDEIGKWTGEERDTLVNVFKWLIEEDKKQNPNLYTKSKPQADSESDNGSPNSH